MKKILFCIFCFAITYSAFSQKHPGFVTQNNPFYQIPTLQLPASSKFMAYKLQSVSTFSIYNYTTGFNETYKSTASNHYYSTPTFIHSNKYRGVKVDSFNPHGSQDLGNAVINGLLSLIF